MTRIDIFLTENGIVESRNRAQTLIKNGNIFVDGKVISKPSFEIKGDEDIKVTDENICPYVSRGGIKLKTAIDAFGIDAREKVCLDIGASTGGFTDCLLKEGARKVFAVDTGFGQLHPLLKSDVRVVSLENVNARYLEFEAIKELCDICVMDVSFISQTKLYPAIVPLVKDGGIMITLIKPQFEVGRSGIGKGGIVKDEKLRKKAVEFVKEQAEIYGMVNCGCVPSAIKGGDGNTEYLAYFIKK